MKRSPILLFLLFSLFTTKAQNLNVSAGRLVRAENFPSQFVQSRNIDIWLPESYSTTKKYSVLYMLDGQMLFNSNNNEVRLEWRVDEIMDSLLSVSAIQNCIVVGIWNTAEQRLAEYFPSKMLDDLSTKNQKKFISDKLRAEPSSDEFLKFVVYELKPYIDRNFSVFSNPDNTYIAGADAGALLSLYAMCEYPSVFHAAACISSFCSFMDERISKAILYYLKKHIPDSFSHRIYIDFDKRNQDSHADYFQFKIAELFSKNKYTEKNYISKEKYDLNPGEETWCKNLQIPIIFLLGKH